MSHVRWYMVYDSETPHPLYQTSVIEKIIKSEPGTVILIDYVPIMYFDSWDIVDVTKPNVVTGTIFYYKLISDILIMLCPKSEVTPILLSCSYFSIDDYYCSLIETLFSKTCRMLDKRCDICCKPAFICHVEANGPHLCKTHGIEMNNKRREQGQSTNCWKLCNPRAVHIVQTAIIYHNRKTDDKIKNFSLVFEKLNPTQPFTKFIIGRFVCTLDAGLENIDQLFVDEEDENSQSENEQEDDSEDDDDETDSEDNDDEVCNNYVISKEVCSEDEVNLKEDCLWGLDKAHELVHPYNGESMGHIDDTFNRCICVLRKLRNSIYGQIV